MAGWQRGIASAHGDEACAAVCSRLEDGGVLSVSSSRERSSAAHLAQSEHRKQSVAPLGWERTQAGYTERWSHDPIGPARWQPGRALYSQQQWSGGGNAGTAGLPPLWLHRDSAVAGNRGSQSTLDSESSRRQLRSGSSAATSPAGHDHRPRQASSEINLFVRSPCNHGAAHGSLTDKRHASRHMHSQSGKDGASAGPAAASVPAPATTWLDRYCPKSVLPFAQLIRLDKPIGEGPPVLPLDLGRMPSCVHTRPIMRRLTPARCEALVTALLPEPTAQRCHA